MSMAQVSSASCTSVYGICSARSSSSSSLPRLPLAGFRTAFATGSPLGVTWKASQGRRTYAVVSKASPIPLIRCEQTSSNGLDVWLGRSAMIGFAAAISVEIATGKGLLENFGLTRPLPTVALAVTALVGVLTSIFISQSSSSTKS